MSVFVTVGTTLFEDLVETVSQKTIIQLLENLGYSRLVIQYGKGNFVPESRNHGKLRVEAFDFKQSIAKDIADADLVISHAGAGSCLEVLTANKKLIVVVNEKLMDNHQYELAEQLYKDQHLLYCTTRTLEETIRSMQTAELVPFPKAETEKFSNFMDDYLGIVQ